MVMLGCRTREILKERKRSFYLGWIMMPSTKLENIGDSDLGRHDDELGFGHAKSEVFVKIPDGEIWWVNRTISVRDQGKICSRDKRRGVFNI